MLVHTRATAFTFALVFIFGFSILSQTAYAASYVNVSSGSGGTVSLGSIKPSSTGVSASGSDTLTITTNCSAGYSVYVSGQEGKGTSLTNSSASTNNTISASETTVGSTATTLNSNTWGITGDSSNASASKYVGLPSYANATNKALISNPSASTSEDNKDTIYYGVKVDTSLTPGTYSGDVLYTTLVSDKCNNYTVKFDANGGTGTMDNQTIPVGTATALTKNAFERTGYTFLGWSTDKNATTPTYKDGEKVTDLTDFNSSIILYAIWAQIAGDMQSWTGCPSLATSQSVFLTDTRDSKVYAVKKLPDGKCWMMQNLTIGSDGAKTLTPENTNINNDTTYYLPPAGKQGSNTIEDADTLTAATAASFTGSASDDKHPKTQFRIKDDSITNDSDTGYYNFYTATLGFSWYGTGSSGSSTRDICPKGWRMPKTTDNGSSVSSGSPAEFTALVNGYATDPISGTGNISTSNTDVKNSMYINAASPLAATTRNDYAGFAYSGHWYSAGTDASDVGSIGLYWASSVYGTNYSYYMYLNSSSVWPQRNANKYRGYAIRCVAQDSYTINYSSSSSTSGNPSKTTEGTIFENDSIILPTVGSMVKDGYDFKGWALTSSASEAAYTAEQTVTISDLLTAASSAGQATTAGSTITLYPVWEKSVAYMQDWADCPSLAENATIYLKDKRDGTTYSVKKLGSDCWMTSNLTLGSTGIIKMTPEDTNISDGNTYYLPKAGTYGSLSDGASKGTPTFTSDTIETSGNAQVQYRAAGNKGDTNNNGSYTLTQNTGYYNFYAATLGKSYYGLDGNTSGYPSADQDICPKGWQLPIYGTTNDKYSWSSLDYAINPSATNVGANRTDAVSLDNFLNLASFFYSGLYDSSQLRNVGYSGHWWASTANSSNSSYRLRLNSSGYVYPQDSHNKYYGFAVRCVAKGTRTISDISTMQEMNSSICSNSKIGENKVLTDTRDQETYRVNKLKDEECWMVENLRISDIELDSTTSDLATGTKFTVPKSTNEAFTASNAGTVAKMALSTDATNARAYGGYYNFVAATAGSGSGYDAGTTSGTYSICPKGWTLPTKDQFVNLDKSFGYSGENRQNLQQIENSYLNNDYANGYPSFTLSGRYYTDYPSLYATQRAHYWSSTVASAANAYNLLLNTGDTNLYPQFSHNKFDGYSVRCLAR